MSHNITAETAPPSVQPVPAQPANAEPANAERAAAEPPGDQAAADQPQPKRSPRPRWRRVLSCAMLRLAADEAGMSTAEYAIGTIAAAAFGAILYTVVTGDNIVNVLTGIIGKALNTAVG
ncbi:hypothetical protein GS4_08_01900 [Gordonia soli NBRC 108243]|uniref:DUF4244 domain-containing protein n=2 Tax=Gordonia soli TaxID=320799 RepID=M0QG49_9ACTN|nr:hypothetical protein GS4_08_01900 [Gordonia soli NBRC 108243]